MGTDPSSVPATLTAAMMNIAKLAPRGRKRTAAPCEEERSNEEDSHRVAQPPQSPRERVPGRGDLISEEQGRSADGRADEGADRCSEHHQGEDIAHALEVHTETDTTQ